MVADDLVNSEGQLTKHYGGEAEPEPWAQRSSLIDIARSVSSRRQRGVVHRAIVTLCLSHRVEIENRKSKIKNFYRASR